MPKTIINPKRAKKVKAAQEKVQVHRAHKAGTLKSAFDRITLVANTLALLHAESDKTLQGEIELLQTICRRFVSKVKTQQGARTGLLQRALQEVQTLQRELQDAAGKGYSLKKLAREHERDIRAVTQIRGNIQTRAREASFILAELEQVVNPVSGLKMVSAAQRAKNEKQRKEVIAKFQKSGNTDSEPPAVEQTPAESTS